MEVYWLAHFKDGTTLKENTSSWREVVKKGIANITSLQLYCSATNAYHSISGKHKYFQFTFMEVTVSSRGNDTTMRNKMIGYIKKDKLHILKLNPRNGNTLFEILPVKRWGSATACYKQLESGEWVPQIGENPGED
jgi:hypothetical protein